MSKNTKKNTSQNNLNILVPITCENYESWIIMVSLFKLGHANLEIQSFVGLGNSQFLNFFLKISFGLFFVVIWAMSGNKQHKLLRKGSVEPTKHHFWLLSVFLLIILVSNNIKVKYFSREQKMGNTSER